MNVPGLVAALFVSLTLSACADPTGSSDPVPGVSPADTFIGKVTPGSENDSKFNRGIGATPTY